MQSSLSTNSPSFIYTSLLLPDNPQHFYFKPPHPGCLTVMAAAEIGQQLIRSPSSIKDLYLQLMWANYYIFRCFFFLFSILTQPLMSPLQRYAIKSYHHVPSEAQLAALYVSIFYTLIETFAVN